MDPVNNAQPVQGNTMMGGDASSGSPMQSQPQPAMSQPVPPPAPNPAPVQSQPQPAQQQIPQLNDQFLQEAGLGVLPEVERQGMLEQMRKTLETNVGMEIYKNLQPHQLDEFEGFMPLNDEQGNVVVSVEQASANAQRWLDANVQGWRSNPGLQPYINDMNAVTNFAAMNWLQRNFPAYRDVVAAEMNKLMTEVKSNVPKIIEAVMGPQNLQQPQQPQMQVPPANPAMDAQPQQMQQPMAEAPVDQQNMQPPMAA